jgi:SAM-dependent methyltransferase
LHRIERAEGRRNGTQRADDVNSNDPDLLATADDWEKLAASDPLWAVMVAPEHKGNRWPVDEFMQSGRDDWAAQQAWLGELQLPASGERALDFGCGVGRMALALSASYETVVGVDISTSMLKLAAELDTSEGRCVYVENAATDLHAVDDYAPFDFVHTLIVLQHVPNHLIPGYLSEFVRLLKPGGVLTFQLPERPVFSVKGLAFRYLPSSLVGFLQRRLFHYPAPMRMSGMSEASVRRVLNEAGATVVAIRSDDSYGGYWHSKRYVAKRDAPAATTPATPPNIP